MARRVKMDVSNRAKQFVPFAALKGFEEAMREKERENDRKRGYQQENEIKNKNERGLLTE